MQTAASRVSDAFGPLFPATLRKFLPPLEPAVQRLLMPPELSERVEAACTAAQDRPLPESLLASLDITYSVGGDEKIPRSGPAMVVANHPFGMVEGIILTDMLAKIRSDVRVLANSLLAVIPALDKHLIPVDVFGGVDAPRRNAAPVRRALEWVRAGGMLAVFPAGEVAHLNWKERPVTDPSWNPIVARFARLASCSVTPVFFAGSNSAAFQMAGTLHPRFRTISLPRELYNKRGRCIEARVGVPVPASAVRQMEDERAVIDYLRCRTYLLGERLASANARRPKPMEESVAPPVPADELGREVGALTPLCGSGALRVYVARAVAIPRMLREIGRLRELTFRIAGEGTGAREDLDEFDNHYQHLFVWNSEARELVGAYRLGPTLKSWRHAALPGYTPARCSSTTPGYSSNWDPLWNWAGPSCARNTSGNTRRSCCFGRG